jgi:hypothetical protein
MEVKELDGDNFSVLRDPQDKDYYLLTPGRDLPDPENMDSSAELIEEISNRGELFFMELRYGNPPEGKIWGIGDTEPRQETMRSVPLIDDQHGFTYSSDSSRDPDPEAAARHMLYHWSEEGFSIEWENNDELEKSQQY